MKKKNKPLTRGLYASPNGKTVTFLWFTAGGRWGQTQCVYTQVLPVRKRSDPYVYMPYEEFVETFPLRVRKCVVE